MTDAGDELIQSVLQHLREHGGTAHWEDLCQELGADASRIHAALSHLIENGEVELASSDPPCNPSYRLAS